METNNLIWQHRTCGCLNHLYFGLQYTENNIHINQHLDPTTKHIQSLSSDISYLISHIRIKAFTMNVVNKTRD